MIATLIVLCTLAQANASAQLLIKEHGFLKTMSEASIGGRELAQMMQAKDAIWIKESTLNAEALSFSNSWLAKILNPKVSLTAAKAPWTGRHGTDSIRKLFVRSWTSPMGEVTWSDMGLLAVIHFRAENAFLLGGVEEAQDFIESNLQRMLRLPVIPQGAIKWYVKPLESASGTKIYGGNVLRNVRMGPPERLPNGDVREVGLEYPLKWHQFLYVFTDGANIVVRVHFSDADERTLGRVSDHRTRFSHSGH